MEDQNHFVILIYADLIPSSSKKELNNSYGKKEGNDEWITYLQKQEIEENKETSDWDHSERSLEFVWRINRQLIITSSPTSPNLTIYDEVVDYFQICDNKNRSKLQSSSRQTTLLIFCTSVNPLQSIRCPNRSPKRLALIGELRILFPSHVDQFLAESVTKQLHLLNVELLSSRI